MRGWSLGQGTRQRYLSVRRQECSLPGTPSSLGLTVWGSFCCIRVSGTPVRWSLSLETPPSGRRLSDWGLSLDSSQSRVAPLWGLVPRTLSWSFTSLKGSRGCLSPKLVCARTWVSTRLHCTRPHTHTLAALPSREARVWQMPSCGQGWLGLDRTRLSVAPLASPLDIILTGAIVPSACLPCGAARTTLAFICTERKKRGWELLGYFPL